ncbi:MAG: hypothetical protein ACYTEL_15690 [Planctomycetota bacterium]|jgi:hypothetical protein
MTAKCSKRSYYLPVDLIERFADSCKPGRDYSPKIAGLILGGMALDDPALLVKLGKLAHSGEFECDPKTGKVVGKAIEKALRLIVETVLGQESFNALATMLIQRAIDTKNDSEKQLCLDVLRAIGRPFDPPKRRKRSRN